LAGERIDAAEVRAFVSVATSAGQREIVESCGAAVLAGNDVVDGEAQTVNVLGHQAVFASVLCPAPDFLVHRAVH
jgi:hypothetical protein